MIMVILFLFLLNGCLSIQVSPCGKWYTTYGCENKMVLIKNILMHDTSSYLSTQVLSHNPEKKIACLFDFGLPNYLKHDIINSIIQDQQTVNFSDQSLLDTVYISKLKYLSKYMDSFMIHNPPLYIHKSSYDKFGLNQGLYDSLLEHGTKLRVSTKGKPFNFQLNVAYQKSQVSELWAGSLHSDKYDAVFNIGKNSNIWSRYNYLYINIDTLIFSDTEIPKSFYFNENKIKIKCFSNERILDTLLFEKPQSSNKTLLNLVVDSRCTSLNTVILKKSHLREYYTKNEYFNIIIDLNSKLNYLPPKLFYILYKSTTETSGLTKKIKKNDVPSNFIELGFINSNDNLRLTSDGTFDFTFDVNDNNNIILGADIFTYFSQITYDNQIKEYTFWVNDITSNNNFILILINFIFIFEILLFFRWYLTSNTAISNYIIFNILTNRDTFYYNNSQVFAEIIAILFSSSMIGLCIYTFINTSNLPIYLIVSFSMQCFLILLLCIVTLVFIIQSRDKLKTILFNDKGEILPTNNEKRSRDWHINGGSLLLPFSNVLGDNYIPVFIPKKKEEEGEGESYVDKETDKMRKHREKTQLAVDKAVLRLYALTTTKVLNQNILICVGRNLIHMSLILLTMITGLTVLIDDKLTKAILTLLSMIIVYYFNYYILLLLYIIIHFYSRIKNRVLWLSFIIIFVLFLFVLTPYIAFTFVFNFLDSSNANHSTFVVALAAILLVLITTVVPSKTLLNNIEKWKSILQNDIKLIIKGIEISKED
jgi:hypothetical protein